MGPRRNRHEEEGKGPRVDEINRTVRSIFAGETSR